MTPTRIEDVVNHHRKIGSYLVNLTEIELANMQAVIISESWSNLDKAQWDLAIVNPGIVDGFKIMTFENGELEYEEYYS